jgi:hypothetical protein
MERGKESGRPLSLDSDDMSIWRIRDDRRDHTTHEPTTSYWAEYHIRSTSLLSEALEYLETDRPLSRDHPFVIEGMDEDSPALRLTSTGSCRCIIEGITLEDDLDPFSSEFTSLIDFLLGSRTWHVDDSVYMEL